MISPDGRHGDIPASQVAQAKAAGFKVGVDMLSPDGQRGVIPAENYGQAVAAGFKVNSQTQNASSQNQDPGFFHGVDEAFGNVWDTIKQRAAQEDSMSWKDRLKEGATNAVMKNPGLGLVPSLVAKVASDAYDQGKQAVTHGVKSVQAGLKGNFNEANLEASEVQPHLLAAQLPFVGPVAAKAGEDIGSGRPAEGAGEAIGAIGQVVAPDVIEGTGKAIPPIVRGTAKAVNLALEKAPTAIGTTAGAVIGHATGVPYGSEIGAGTGAIIGNKVLPTLRIPGENFGLPKPVYPGAPFPEAPPPESSPFGAGKPIAPKPSPFGAKSPAQVLFEQRPQPMAAAPVTGAEPTPGMAEPTRIVSSGTIPRTPSGDMVLNRVLAAQDNANLIKIAKSRGIDVTAESQLKPGAANGKIIDKIIDDFSPEELDNMRDTYLQNSLHGAHQFGDIGPEAWRTKSLQTYFPDLKISKAALARTDAAVSAAQPSTAPAEDLATTLQKSLDQVNAAKQAAKSPAQKLFESRPKPFDPTQPWAHYGDLAPQAESDAYESYAKDAEMKAQQASARGDTAAAQKLLRSAKEWRAMKLVPVGAQ